MISRRTFVKAGGSAFALLAMRRKMYGFSQSPALQKWVQPIAGLGPSGIPVAASDGTRTWGRTVATHSTIDIRQYTQRLHPSLGPTTLWGYGQGADSSSWRHLGGLIVAKQNAPVQITFRNYLPTSHFLPVDASSFFPDASLVQNKTSVHLHGGLVPWISDGGPYDYFTPAADGGAVGPSFINNQVLRSGSHPGEAEYYYPNAQSARLAWYHDHAHDLTRLNAYAGVASGYIIRDDLESLLIRQGAIPSAEVPLVFQDKIFQQGGSLWYPDTYDPARWAVYAGPPTPLTMPLPSCIPEMFGDTILGNGVVYPQVTVQARRYRFRMLNACNARFLNLQLYQEDATNLPEGLTLKSAGVNDPNGNPIMIPDPSRNAAGPKMLAIGNETGFLFQTTYFNNPPTPVAYDSLTGNVTAHDLLLAPGERADVIIDFSGLAGKKFLLYNDAPAPFPGGDPLNDYYVGSPNPTPTTPGYGPNTRTLVEFNVVDRVGAADPLTMTQVKSILDAAFAKLVVLPTTTLPIRDLTLNEEFDEWGRLIQRLGTATSSQASPARPVNGIGMTDYGRDYSAPPTETLNNHDVEKWRIWNLTGDTHPMHFHLINFRVLSRQDFDGIHPDTSHLIGSPKPIEPFEYGWKETVRINPGEVLTFIARFDLPTVPFTVPPSPRTGGNEYVYHCHILEHEEHDMMRPLIIT